MPRKKKSDKPYGADTSPLFFNSMMHEGLVQELPLEQIVIRKQARTYFDEEEIKELAESIKRHEVLQPIIVRPTKNPKVFEHVIGEKRIRASRIAGIATIPAKIKQLTDIEVLEYCAIENNLRNDPNPYEKMVSALEIVAVKANVSLDDAKLLIYQVHYNLTHNVVGDTKTTEAVVSTLEFIGFKLDSFVKHLLPLYELPEDVKEVLEKGEIKYSVATLIKRIKDKEKRKLLLETAIAEKWTVRRTKEEVKHLLDRDRPPEPEIKSKFKQLSGRVNKAIAKDKLDKLAMGKLEHLMAQIEEILTE